MFEFLRPIGDHDVMNIIKDEHQKVKDLFEQFEGTEDRAEKKKIVAKTLEELKMHATVEEEIFYRSIRPLMKDKLMNEADEEHHVAKVLIAELSQMDGSEDHYDAKFHVLAENIRHHIREEEDKVHHDARKLELDFSAMGARFLQRKEELAKTGIPICAEERMVAGVHGSDDSSAMMARKTSFGKSKAKAKAKSKNPAGKNTVKKMQRSVVKAGKKAQKALTKTAKKTGLAALKIVKGGTSASSLKAHGSKARGMKAGMKPKKAKRLATR